jgi:uncharacterized membrane protein
MNEQLVRATNLIGAITANAYFVLIISVFVLRMAGRTELARWVGLASFVAIVPLLFLLVTAFRTDRPSIYFLWVGLAVAFLAGELFVDYILNVQFRTVAWATVLYVVVFFAATGGMIGIAGQAGTRWTAATVVVFFVMAVLAFVQRGRTGL